MSNMNDSSIGRLLFWFLWLSGLVFSIYLLLRFFYFGVVSVQFQLAVPFFISFIWQGIVQVFALKRYQHAEHLKDPFIIQLLGSFVLIALASSIMLFRT